MTTLDISTLEYLETLWVNHPKRKGAYNDVRRLHTRIELAGNQTHKALSRSGLESAGDIAFARSIDSQNKGRIRSWLREPILPGLGFIIFLVAVGFACFVVIPNERPPMMNTAGGV